MMKKKLQQNKGFVLLFAIILCTIIIAITIGITNITYKELHFTANAQDANDAFYAADAGVECALYLDKNINTPFELGHIFDAGLNVCPGIAFNVVNEVSSVSTEVVYDFVFGINQSPNQCAKVYVKRDYSYPTPVLTVISKGYVTNGDVFNCTVGTNTTERQLEVEDY